MGVSVTGAGEVVEEYGKLVQERDVRPAHPREWARSYDARMGAPPSTGWKTDTGSMPNATSIIRKIFGLKARFCTDGCAESFREDRKARLIYSAYKFPTGKFVNPEPASVIGNHCCYCNAACPGPIPASHRELHKEAYGFYPEEAQPETPAAA